MEARESRESRRRTDKVNHVSNMYKVAQYDWAI